jgi:Na+-driven multidrug efflux pump
VTDCFFASIHFCFSGYFSACGMSIWSFIHNAVSIVTLRIPGAYLASKYYPETLYPMGLAAPSGSLLSALICFGVYFAIQKKEKD